MNNINDKSFGNRSIAVIYNQFNPIEKIVELCERILDAERKKNEHLEARIKKLEGGN